MSSWPYLEASWRGDFLDCDASVVRGKWMTCGDGGRQKIHAAIDQSRETRKSEQRRQQETQRLRVQ